MELFLAGIIKIHNCKDTILRSTINDYFENRPDGRLTAWVLPRITKMLPLRQNATPVSNLPSSNLKIGKPNTQTYLPSFSNYCMMIYPLYNPCLKY